MMNTNLTKIQKLCWYLKLTANEIVQRATVYTVRTKQVYLNFLHNNAQGYIPPLTRKKPTDQEAETYSTHQYNTSDGIIHSDDLPPTQDYSHPGPPIILTCQTDCRPTGHPAIY
jgi:hypothetical protein